MKKVTPTELKSVKQKFAKPSNRNPLAQLNLDAAGIDIGSKSHFVCVPDNRDDQSVREFSSFTEDLEKMADWLQACGVKTIAMESTGVYWIPVYEILTSRGFEVKLVDARHVKNVSGRKTDVLDCQWLQQLHTYGLLSGGFIPDGDVLGLRAYMRQRDMLVQGSVTHIHHMQKALFQMNIQLDNVVTDITGITGMKIIRAIIAGEQDPQVLATYRDRRCKNSEEVIRKSLVGHYQSEHIFELQQAVELYDTYQEKIKACDVRVEEQMVRFEPQVDMSQYELQPVKKQSKGAQKNTPDFDVRGRLIQMTGVDLTLIPGINALSALQIVSVVGTDMAAWPTSKHFESWLGLCPGNKVSGGKRLGGRSKKTSNSATKALRLGAQALHKSPTALGAYYRRMRGRIGAPKANTATARKLSARIYHMLKYKKEYIEMGQDYYEKQYQDRILKGLQKKAAQLGFSLIKQEGEPLNNNQLLVAAG